MAKNKTKKTVASKKLADKWKDFLNRRSHRSFRITKRRDYVRPLNMPGYISFTNTTFKVIWKNRRVFGLLALLYGLLTLVMVGMASQDTYSALRSTINIAGGSLFSGAFGQIGKAGILFAAAATGNLSSNLSDAQQISAGLIFLMSWLTSVWLLRNILAGKKVRLRDGLYSSGAPILATFVVSLVLAVQLIPAALALIGISAAGASGVLSSGVAAMLFWLVAILLAVLSLYWITSTLLALVIVTLPGMYPFRALKAAGDLVAGRRLRVIYRILWLIVSVAIVWAIVLIPVIMIDSWVKGLWPVINWLPIVPVVLLVISSLTVVYASAYIYLLYRKVVDDEVDFA